MCCHLVPFAAVHRPYLLQFVAIPNKSRLPQTTTHGNLRPLLNDGSLKQMIVHNLQIWIVFFHILKKSICRQHIYKQFFLIQVRRDEEYASQTF